MVILTGSGALSREITNPKVKKSAQAYEGTVLCDETDPGNAGKLMFSRMWSATNLIIDFIKCVSINIIENVVKYNPYLHGCKICCVVVIIFFAIVF